VPSRCGPSGHEGQSGDLPVPAQGVYAHAKALRPRRVRRRLALAPPSMLPSTRPPVSALWINRFRGAIPRLRAPLPTSRLPPHGDLRTARGRCGSLDLHRRGLPPPTPCQSPGKSGRSVAVSASGERVSAIYNVLAFRLPRAGGGPGRLCERHQRFCSQRVDVALRHRPPPYGWSPQSLARAPLRLFGAGP
jgi:hypothetical protein